jgi:hypothetical protein
MLIKSAALSLVFLLTSCAVLHHAQLGDIDNQSQGTPFSVKVSEMGINLREGTEIAKAMTRSIDARNSMDTINEIISAFQMGPHTGNGVFNDHYAEALLDMIRKECPSGKVSGLISVRETRKYPVISGEIVKINGYCMR